MTRADTPTPARRRMNSARGRRRRTIAIAAVFVIVAGWLYFAPPLISYAGAPTSCRPLAAGLLQGGTLIGGLPSYAPAYAAVDQYLDNRADEVTDQDRFEAELGVAERCSDARLNQHTTLVLVTGGGIAALLGLVLRRLGVIRLAQHRQTATLQRLGPGESPGGAGMD
ncbi:hypothetical protein [Leucobacter chromiiresistens]|nr:hypothetical protein [Leucobacter chromiiresistens]